MISQHIYRVTLPISLLLTSLSSRFLPEQYFRDSNYLLDRSKSSVAGISDPYQVIINIYKIFGISDHTIYLSLIQWMLFVGLLALARKGQYQPQIEVNLISIFYLFLIPFYGSMLTKELLIAVLVLVVLISNRKTNASPNTRFLTYCILCTAISITIRQYYFITLATFILLRLMYLNKKNTLIITLGLIVPIMASLNAKFSIFARLAGVNIFLARNRVEALLQIKPRTTIFQTDYSTNPLINISIYLKVLQQMFLPWQILQGSTYNKVTFLTIIFLTGIAIGIVHLIMTANTNTPEFLFILSYFLVSTIFEPDLGSFLRHTFPLLPILVYGLNTRLRVSFLGTT